MSNKENYKKLFLEKVNENLKLKQEIEICQKKLELSKSLNNSFDFFDKCYNPLRNEYKFVYQRLEYLFTRVQELKNIYNQRLLLNPNFSNIKIRDEEKMKIRRTMEMFPVREYKIDRMNLFNESASEVHYTIQYGSDDALSTMKCVIVPVRVGYYWYLTIPDANYQLRPGAVGV